MLKPLLDMHLLRLKIDMLGKRRLAIELTERVCKT